MRYIDMVRLLRERDDWPPSEKWEKRVRKAEAALRNLPPGKTRAKIFDQYSDVWSEVKEQFRQISHQKCWYCETETSRIRGDIDHYRPKGGVTDTDHPGYWWLAFQWRNWRFSCELCNSKLTDRATDIVGGKGNDFPLEDGESRRIWDECEHIDYDDLKKERPMLLDPTNPGDPELITFGGDGLPRPAAKDKMSIEYQRADISIKTYHLDHTALCRRRRTAVIHPLHDLVEKIQKYKLVQSSDRNNDDLDTIIEDGLRDLRKMIAPDAQYSSTARAYLKRYRRWAWVDRLLTAS